MTPTQTVTITAEIFCSSKASTTLFVAIDGSVNAGQFMFKGAGHAARASAFCVAVTGTFDAMTAILTIDAATMFGHPSISPGFGFAATIIETARAA